MAQGVVVPIRLTTEDAVEPHDGHELTMESAVLWIRELEARIARMERAFAGIKSVCPLAARAPPT